MDQVEEAKNSARVLRAFSSLSLLSDAEPRHPKAKSALLMQHHILHTHTMDRPRLTHFASSLQHHFRSIDRGLWANQRARTPIADHHNVIG
jgi:hypothetical protein